MQRMLGKQTTILCYFMRCMAKLPDYFGKDISLLLLSNISDLIIPMESRHNWTYLRYLYDVTTELEKILKALK